jgi:TRAP-type C4-dicarboxylate transport system permease small subunit
MSISTILTYIYLFCGLLIATYVLLASYNIYTKGYRATSAFLGIILIMILFSISFGSALTTIHNLGTAIDKAIPTALPTNSSPTSPSTTIKGKFY